MSVEAISHIMRTHIPDGVAKLVAMVLADYADPVTGRCWPKVPTLALQCSQSERTVQRKLKALEGLGVLHVEPNTSGDRKGNVYILHLPTAERGGPTRRRSPPPDTGDRGGGSAPAAAPTGDTQSPVSKPDRSPDGHPTGDSVDTRRVTLRSPPRDSTRESTKGIHSEPCGSGAGEPSPRAKLFSEGRPLVMALGVDQRAAGDMIGRWLRDAHDDAARVLDAIRRARDAAPHAPIPWITAQLRAPDDGPRAAAAPPRRSTHGALSLLARRIGARHDARRNPPADLDLGPVIEHEGARPADGTLDQRPGDAPRGFPAPVDPRRARALG